jgi:uncharacterized protein
MSPRSRPADVGRGHRHRGVGPVHIPVAPLLREPVGTSRTFDLTDVRIPDHGGPQQTAGGDGTIRLTRTNRGIYATGTFRTVVAESCSRCLRAIDLPIVIEIEEEFLPSIDPTTGVPLPQSGEPDTARLTDAHELDLGTLLADELSLREPIAPICRPDCPGLCPTCGRELSDGPHDHGETAIDPRLAVLSAIHVDEEAENG